MHVLLAGNTLPPMLPPPRNARNAGTKRVPPARNACPASKKRSRRQAAPFPQMHDVLALHVTLTQVL